MSTCVCTRTRAGCVRAQRPSWPMALLQCTDQLAHGRRGQRVGGNARAGLVGHVFEVLHPCILHRRHCGELTHILCVAAVAAAVFVQRLGDEEDGVGGEDRRRPPERTRRRALPAERRRTPCGCRCKPACRICPGSAQRTVSVGGLWCGPARGVRRGAVRCSGMGPWPRARTIPAPLSPVLQPPRTKG